MTDSNPPALSRDDILNSFLREAEAATNQVIAVSEKLTAFRAAEEAVRNAYAEFSEQYREAVAIAAVATKLDELDMPDPSQLSVTIGGTPRSAAKRPAARKARPAGAGKRPAANRPDAAAPATSGVGAERADGAVKLAE